MSVPLTMPVALPVTASEPRPARSESTGQRETATPGGTPAGIVSGTQRECSMCSQPAPGLTCERCMRYELSKPAMLLAYDAAALDEMADSALDAARYWIKQAASLRAEAARRAE